MLFWSWKMFVSVSCSISCCLRESHVSWNTLFQALTAFFNRMPRSHEILRFLSKKLWNNVVVTQNLSCTRFLRPEQWLCCDCSGIFCYVLVFSSQSKPSRPIFIKPPFRFTYLPYFQPFSFSFCHLFKLKWHDAHVILWNAAILDPTGSRKLENKT